MTISHLAYTVYERLYWGLFFWCAILPITTFGKYSSNTQYTRENGLPGNSAYSIYQDRSDYLWISTENGLVRFNGYEFKLLTTKNGLPDNEVFNLSEDKKGRLWFTPFANDICYIKNEEIHHTGNDPILKNLHFNARPTRVLFDDDGNTFFFVNEQVISLNNSGKIVATNFRYGNEEYMATFQSDSGRLNILYNWTIFEYRNGQFIKKAQLPALTQGYQTDIFYQIIAQTGLKEALPLLQNISLRKLPFFTHIPDIQKIRVIRKVGPHELIIAREDGLFFVDMNSGLITDTLLKGIYINTVAQLHNGTIWVGTRGNGVFHIFNSPIKTLNLPLISPLQFIKGSAKGILAVLEKSIYVGIDLPLENSPAKTAPVPINRNGTYSICNYLGKNIKGDWISCSDKISTFRNLAAPPLSILKIKGWCKDVKEEDTNHLLIAMSNHLIRLNKDNCTIKDTLLKKRSTSVAKVGSTVYVGTLEGLIAGTLPGNFKLIFPNHPSLKGHIVELDKDVDGHLWIANNRGELTVTKGNNVIAVISDKNGLRCNRISSVKSTTDFIWVGTDNGLFAIRNTAPYPIVRHLTYTSGLCNNQINCLDVANGMVLIGTDNGMNYFFEKAVFQKTPSIKLNINNITNGTTKIDFTSKELILPSKSLNIDFDVIDHYGGQTPIFQYRLSADTNWTTLENSNLFFPDVPYGKFKVSLRALSPNWKQPAQKDLFFYKSYPFYFRWWFIALLGLLVSAGVVFGTTVFIRTTRKKDQEKLLIQRNLLQLEQLALQGQMNPHFIFNCITAIKQNYNAGDLAKANSFVDVFTALIRQTFEMVVETFVPLDRELSYLNQYLLVEKARFDQSFDFVIQTNVVLPASSIPVPAMMLQPLVENAIRHGVRHLGSQDRRGLITIVINQQLDKIEISLSDNGVGRAKSEQFGRFLNPVKVTSTMVNAKRIDILNKLFNNQIIHRTDDLTDADGNVTGTRVIVSYPLNIQNET